MKTALQISSNILSHDKEAEDKLTAITKSNLYFENIRIFLNILYLKQRKNSYEFY